MTSHFLTLQSAATAIYTVRLVSLEGAGMNYAVIG